MPCREQIIAAFIWQSSAGFRTWPERGLSWILLLAVEKKYLEQHGCCLKPAMDCGERSE
jgi:hypothetical protein